jgi:AGCS family alanine or glycine:cation symporter
MIAELNAFVETVNGLLFSSVTVFALLLTGVVFTIWSRFGQYTALSHGVSVVRGKYDRPGDPGAINHFQALSAALSATVGLGNIGGVAIAVALGGPGAVLWMWAIGVVGMALKMTEVTQSMIYRVTTDPEDPHGGPMFVAREGFRRLGFPTVGKVVGGIFVATLVLATMLGGNMFQAWNVADVTFNYFGVPQIVTGIVLAVAVGLVIIGGIKRIGAVAARIVPVMCLIYLLAASYVLALKVDAIPGVLVAIVRAGLPTWAGGESACPEGAFLGGTFGYAAMWGVKRALFSSEAGQGSAPIAHSAAKTDEPVREGIVAGLEPFLDTVVVCTLTALVILSTGAHVREPAASFSPAASVRVVPATAAEAGDEGARQWTLQTDSVPPKTSEAMQKQGITEGDGWRAGETVMVRLVGSPNPDTGSNLTRIGGAVRGNAREGFRIEWGQLHSAVPPVVQAEADGSVGLYEDYTGASLTAHAFDRVAPGLGKWLVVLASWLFALSTMISWSYYGEQGMVYLLRGRGLLTYKVLYCGLIVVTTLGFITTDSQLDAWTTLGLGVMLVVNIPLMLVFGHEAMRAYRGYVTRLRKGEFHQRGARALTDVVEGKDEK